MTIKKVVVPKAGIDVYAMIEVQMMELTYDRINTFHCLKYAAKSYLNIVNEFMETRADRYAYDATEYRCYEKSMLLNAESTFVVQ